jgi:ribose-phosphate pyrophosphokinase
MTERNLQIVVMSNAKELGSLVYEKIKKKENFEKEHLINIEPIRFANGEGKVKLKESVRGGDVFILCDIGNYGMTYDFFDGKHSMSPDEHFADLKRVILAIRGNTKRITVGMPLLPFSRQHKRNGRESLDCAWALQELKNMGVHNIFTFDVHDPNVQNAIPTTPFDNFPPTKSLLKTFVRKENIDFENTLMLSPDEGAMGRTRFTAGMLGLDIGLFYKRRDYSKIEKGKNPVAEHMYLGKRQDNLNYIIPDDMIASGGSVLDILKQLTNMKPKEVYIMASFSFFTEGTDKFEEAFESGLLSKVYSTNLSYIPKEIKNKPWFECVDCSGLIAEAILAYHYNKPLSPLLNSRKELYKSIQKIITSKQ